MKLNQFILIFGYEKEINKIHKIELNTLYPQKEKYFIFDNNDYEQEIFYDKKYGNLSHIIYF